LRDLDDNLKEEHGIRDIVDTVEFKGALTSDFIMSVLAYQLLPITNTALSTDKHALALSIEESIRSRIEETSENQV
jgi:hypothetical protein